MQVQSVSRQVLHDFWKRWYFPANATLFLVGDFDSEAGGGLAAGDTRQVCLWADMQHFDTLLVMQIGAHGCLLLSHADSNVALLNVAVMSTAVQSLQRNSSDSFQAVVTCPLCFVLIHILVQHSLYRHAPAIARKSCKVIWRLDAARLK